MTDFEEIDAAARALFEKEQPTAKWAAVDEVERNAYRLRLSRQQRGEFPEPEPGKDPDPGRV